ncbi:MAG: type II restriction endonuclease, partial [Chloroflexota bacterium]|nr:type II restriction endonuclease [Chloroflexota bacterium]
MAPSKRHLVLEDIRLAREPEGLLQLWSKLGYEVLPDVTPLPKEAIGFAPSDLVNIRDLYLLSDQEGQLQVILFHLKEDAMTRLRSLAKNFLDRGGHYLLVATTDFRRLTFVNPRREGGKVRIRKLVVDTLNPTRHDLDVLEGLAVEGRDPDELYQAHVEAFDVERVTNRFYREYAALFERVQEAIRTNNRGVAAFNDPDTLHTFTQRLLGRLMFLYFIQEKGWLAGDPKFLSNQYRKTVGDEGNYYALVLMPLFFETLNQRRSNDQSRWGSIPYLNGGLFDRTVIEEENLIYLPNELFDPNAEMGTLRFFNDYNFTITEDTPAEQEVAVDPEMLGKVFENMMEEQERGKSGTRYTPRSIVHYMCREALLGYLEEQTQLPRERLRALFDEEESEVVGPNYHHGLTVREARKIEQALERLRVLDPAVGTGAFLLGMLQEMITLKRAVFRILGGDVARSSALVAEWKREFIAHALHGVDIKPEAIEIAKLRLWLSLVVDLERDQVEPLPNLDYKLRVGNSLLETVDGEPILPELPAEDVPMAPYQTVMGGTGKGVQIGFDMDAATARARTDLAELKEQYFQAEEKAEKERLRQQIETQERAVVLAALEEKLNQIQSRISTLARKGASVNWKGMSREKKELDDLARRQGTLLDLANDVRTGE